MPSPASLLERHTVSLTGPEVREATGLDPETFLALETYGLLRGDHAGTTARTRSRWRPRRSALAAHGLEARHLRPFRTAADREIGLAEQVLATRHGRGDAGRSAPPRSSRRASRCTSPWCGRASPAEGASASRRGAGYGGRVIEVDVLGVRVEMPTNQPIVLLRERDGGRYLPIWIGAAEAAAITYAQQGVVPPRPLTHDLMRDVLAVLGHT